MGDLGALALGSMVSAMFIFVKAELFLPIVGGVFVFSVLSSIIQRTFFRYILWFKGRKKAEKYRFFYAHPIIIICNVCGHIQKRSRMLFPFGLFCSINWVLTQFQKKINF